MAKHEDKKVEDAPKTEIAPATGTALEVIDYGSDAGVGMEGITSDEVKIPFMRVLQANSPQVLEGNGKAIAGARPKMVLNTSTLQVFSGVQGFLMVPCYRDHKYVEYVPRSINGGGFVGVREPDDALVRELRAKQGKFGKLSNGVTKRNEKGEALDGTEIQESFELYSILLPLGLDGLPTGEEFRAIVPFASTQIPVYQGFVGRYDGIKYQGPNGMVKPPLWAHRWKLVVNNQKNKKGDFFGWNVSLFEKNPDGSDAPPLASRLKLTDPLYLAGRAFYDLVKEGKAGADRAADATVAGASSDVDEEIPM